MIGPVSYLFFQQSSKNLWISKMEIYNIVTTNCIYSFEDPEEALIFLDQLLLNYSKKKKLNKSIYCFDWVSCRAMSVNMNRLEKKKLIPVMEQLVPESTLEILAWKDQQEDAIKFSIKKSYLNNARGGHYADRRPYFQKNQQQQKSLPC